MKIILFMNDYLDIYISENGMVRVEIGRIDENGNALREDSYVNSSLSTFMKHMGIDISDCEAEVSKYLLNNSLFIRVRRNANDTGLEYGLYCLDEKTEQVRYNSFDELIDVEVFQKRIDLI